MTQPTPDASPGPADSFQPDTDNREPAGDKDDAAGDAGSGRTPDPALAGAGLSATGKTADQFSPGDEGPGTTYGSSTGTGTEEREVAGADADENAGQTAEGDVEGA